MQLYSILRRPVRWAALVLSLLPLVTACTPDVPTDSSDAGRLPAIFPDYANVTIPYNIAPLRFELTTPADEALAVVSNGRDSLVTDGGSQGEFLFDEDDWADLMRGSRGRRLQVTVYARKGGQWMRYRPFAWTVSGDAIDPYLVYRLIEPGYVLWNKMGIYERNLTSYEQTPLIENTRLENNCMNCHSFNQRNPNQMLLHMRSKHAGTYLELNGVIERINNRLGGDKRALVYPYWHPSGRFIAFSSNNTRQAFHLNSPNRVEVYDLSSDLVVYDTERHELLTDSVIASSRAFETFPCFSPDGRTLYFCSAEARKMPAGYKDVKYSLCAVAFDPERRTFGQRVDTLYSSRQTGKSASFPRVSPDGRYLVFTAASYGNFSIWHRDADLYIIDLTTRRVQPLAAANSPEVESYHSWSSNSRWLVVSSRRMDGLYTRPYLTHIDRQGRATKAFVLPQATPSYYRSLLYSFNIPEFVTGEVPTSQRAWEKAARHQGASQTQSGPH